MASIPTHWIRQHDGSYSPPARTRLVDATVKIPVADLTITKNTDEQKLNKTEKAYLAYLRVLNPPYLGIQNITLKLADDTRYTCDFNWKNEDGRIVFDEVKGFMRDDAKVKIKVAARLYRFFTFRIVRKTKTGWDIEDVNP